MQPRPFAPHFSSRRAVEEVAELKPIVGEASGGWSERGRSDSGLEQPAPGDPGFAIGFGRNFRIPPIAYIVPRSRDNTALGRDGQAGFRARTNALMNLRSISGASRSGSRPALARTSPPTSAEYTRVGSMSIASKPAAASLAR